MTGVVALAALPACFLFAGTFRLLDAKVCTDDFARTGLLIGEMSDRTTLENRPNGFFEKKQRRRRAASDIDSAEPGGTAMDRRQPGRSRVLSGRRATARPSVRSARIHTRSSCAGPATARRRSTNWTTREWLSSECDRGPRRLCVRAADRYATTNVGCLFVKGQSWPVPVPHSSGFDSAAVSTRVCWNAPNSSQDSLCSGSPSC